MIILSHRGYWKDISEKNQEIAFKRSFELGFGTETDIRDYKGELVISHDIANASAMALNDLLNLYKTYHKQLPLALNIKADGLHVKLKQALEENEVANYFVFDMSIPDGLGYLNHSLKTFTRQSEYEKEPSFYESAAGVWLDEFHTHWITKEIIAYHVNNTKQLCIVSPDLHRRDYTREWADYKKIEQELGISHLMLCTDYPEEAKEFFNA